MIRFASPPIKARQRTVFLTGSTLRREAGMDEFHWKRVAYILAARLVAEVPRPERVAQRLVNTAHAEEERADRAAYMTAAREVLAAGNLVRSAYAVADATVGRCPDCNLPWGDHCGPGMVCPVESLTDAEFDDWSARIRNGTSDFPCLTCGGVLRHQPTCAAVPA